MILGIDAGTTAIKAVAYNNNFIPLASGVEEYNLSTPAPNIVETKPDIYWEALSIVLRKIRENIGKDILEIDTLAISSQGESFVVIDKY